MSPTFRELASLTIMHAIVSGIDQKTKAAAVKTAGGDAGKASALLYERSAASAVAYADALIRRLQTTTEGTDK